MYGVRILEAGNATGKIMKERKLNVYHEQNFCNKKVNEMLYIDSQYELKIVCLRYY